MIRTTRARGSVSGRCHGKQTARETKVTEKGMPFVGNEDVGLSNQNGGKQEKDSPLSNHRAQRSVHAYKPSLAQFPVSIIISILTCSTVKNLQCAVSPTRLCFPKKLTLFHSRTKEERVQDGHDGSRIRNMLRRWDV